MGRPDRLNWRLIAASILVVTVATLPAFLAASTIAVAGPDLGYGTQGLGILTSIFFLTASASSSVIGRVVERAGWRRTMRVNAVGAATLLTCVATVVQSVWGLGVVLVVAAALYGLANPAANLALARDVPVTRRGLIFGLKHAGIPSSSLLAGLAVPTIALTIGWRWAYGLAALLAVGVAFLIPPERAHAAASSLGKARPRPSRMAPALLSLLSLGSAFATLAAVALGTFLVDAAIDRGFDTASAGRLLAAGSLASIVARAFYGALADRRAGDGLGWVGLLTGIGAVAFLLMAAAPRASFATLTVVAFVTGWAWPGLLTYGVVRANEGRPAGSTAITQAGVFVGAGVGPAALGWLIERVSVAAAWYVTAASLAVATVIVTLVRARGSREEPVPTGP